VTGDGWTFLHDPAGAFHALDVRAGCPADADVAAAHRELSTPPEGMFAQVLLHERMVAAHEERLAASGR
jgi:N-hydroxyarylamine O-acetyltransferase